MDPEIKRLLEETHALAKDNHRMLRTMRRHQLFSLIGRTIVWAIVLISPLYLYQQYFGTSGMPTSADIQKLLNSPKAGQ